MDDLQPKNILIYRADDDRLRLEVKLENQTIWLSQKQIGELYQKGKASISEHIKNIFQDGELDPKATVRKFRTVQKEGDRQVERLIDHFNLELIMAVGYRVRSHVGVKFRQWATGVFMAFRPVPFFALTIICICTIVWDVSDTAVTAKLLGAIHGCCLIHSSTTFDSV